MKRHCKDCGGKMKLYGVRSYPGIYKMIYRNRKSGAERSIPDIMGL